MKVTYTAEIDVDRDKVKNGSDLSIALCDCFANMEAQLKQHGIIILTPDTFPEITF